MTSVSAKTDPLDGIIPASIRHHRVVRQALTHISAGRGYDNERLEFLGDAIIGAAVAGWLYKHRPDTAEGGLSCLRTALVNRKALAEAAEAIGVGALLQMSRSSRDRGDRENPRLLCSALEALIGAVFIADGATSAHAVCNRILEPYYARLPKDPAQVRDSKSRLQELSQRLKIGRPEYRRHREPVAGRNTFTSVCVLNGQATTGDGHTLKAAEKAAAEAMLARLTGRENPKRQCA